MSRTGETAAQRHARIVAKMVAIGVDEDTARRVADDDARTTAALDACRCPQCGRAILRRADPMHGLPWVNYWCVPQMGGCGYIGVRREDGATIDVVPPRA